MMRFRSLFVLGLLFVCLMMIALKVAHVRLEVLPFASINNPKESRDLRTQTDLLRAFWKDPSNQLSEITEPVYLAKDMLTQKEDDTLAGYHFLRVGGNDLETALQAIANASPSARNNLDVSALERTLCQVLRAENLFDPEVSAWNLQAMPMRAQQLRKRIDAGDRLSLMEQMYANRVLLDIAFPNYIQPSTRSFGSVFAYGVLRRFDDVSFWTLLAAASGALVMWAAPWTPSSDAAQKSLFARTLWILLWLALAGTASSIYLLLVKKQPGTFWWHGFGDPFDEEIRVVQFIEGTTVLLGIACAYGSCVFAMIMLTGVTREAMRKDTAIDPESHRALRLIYSATLVPIPLAVALMYLYGKAIAWFGYSPQFAPEFGRVFALGNFGRWYLPFALVLLWAFVLLFHSRIFAIDGFSGIIPFQGCGKPKPSTAQEVD